MKIWTYWISSVDKMLTFVEQKCMVHHTRWLPTDLICILCSCPNPRPCHDEDYGLEVFRSLVIECIDFDILLALVCQIFGTVGILVLVLMKDYVLEVPIKPHFLDKKLGGNCGLKFWLSFSLILRGGEHYATVL